MVFMQIRETQYSTENEILRSARIAVVYNAVSLSVCGTGKFSYSYFPFKAFLDIFKN